MQVVRLSKSGQIYVPKEYRKKYDEIFFEVKIIGNELRYKPYVKESGFYNLEKKKKYSYEEFLKLAHFSSKNKKEHNLSAKVDQILYDK
jgi:bifunctional DNA-binding transcriptional regulator/antitoxin component of YhaV-PrlF toxin-antitoxin module